MSSPLRARSRDLLILGGAKFVGPALVREALSRGIGVTLINRGTSGPTPDGVEWLRADRTDDAQLRAAVAGRHWRSVIDTCAFVPRDVLAGCRTLSAHADHYILVSAIDALRGWPARPVTGDDETWDCSPDAGDEGGGYAVLKAGCERAVELGFAGRHTVLRPGLIVGPGEDIGRVPWWLKTFATAPRVPVPVEDSPLQMLDVRDLARFALDRHEQPAARSYTIVGPRHTLHGFVDECIEATGSPAEVVPIPEPVLADHEVAPWWELPMWAPGSGGFAHATSVSNHRALEAGLRLRSMGDTVRDTWGWLGSRAEVRWRPKIGLPEEKMQAVLADPRVPAGARGRGAEQ